MAVVLTESTDTARDEQVRPQALAEPSFSIGALYWPFLPIDRADRVIYRVRRVRRADERVHCAGLFACRANEARRAQNLRRVMFYTMRAYVGSMRILQLIDLEVIGLDRAPPPGSLLVANHPSLIDALILLGYVKDAVVVAKRSLQVNPFTWGGIRGANYIVNADPQALIEGCRARILAGETLVLFPECTRTADDGVIRLQRGAAHVAVRSGCPVIPVTIEFSEPLLTKKSRWWLAPRVRPECA